ncbi:MAG: TlpA family protein disulfide reductase [Nannocystaceae bacterium]|nr:TlpA family protein disulfide reductase [Nannocystaceae bacterium]
MRAIALLTVLIAACHGRAPQPPVATPSRTKDVMVLDREGHAVPFDRLRGDVTVVAFWASYCGPCRAELPVLERLAQRYADDPAVRFVAIAVDEPEQRGLADATLHELAPSVVNRFATPEALGPLVAVDDFGRPSIGLPMLTILDRAGHLHAEVGAAGTIDERVAAYARLVELARHNELPERRPRGTDDFVAELRMADCELIVEVATLPRTRARAIDGIVEFLGISSVADTPELRADVAAGLDGGETTFRAPLAGDDCQPSQSTGR